MKDKKIAHQKILIISNSTWNIFNYRLSFIRFLKSKGHQVVIAAPVDNYIKYLNESYFTRHIPLKKLSPYSKNIIKELLLFFEIKKIVKKENPDIVISYTIKPNIYSSLVNAFENNKSFCVITGQGINFKKSVFSKIIQTIYRYAFKHCNGVIFQNKSDLNQFIDRGIISNQKSFLIEGSGINTSHFKPYPRNNRKNFIFLFIGRLLTFKGINEFIKAALQVKEIAPKSEFWVLGKMDLNHPESVKNELFLKWVEHRAIRYLGWVDDVKKYINQADAIVLPAHGGEGTPRVILEAMSMEKPVVTTNTPGCSDTIIHDVNGIIVKPKDVQDLAKGMMTLYLKDSVELAKMGEINRKIAIDKYSTQIVNNTFYKIISNPSSRVLTEKKS
jgi:glycosyltransferase involved in cell wall biosynthesis